MKPDVSIILTTWTKTDYRQEIMERSFLSLKTNTVRPHQLIVIDNGMQKQREFLDKQEMDLRIQNDPNIGVGASRNQGSELVDTEYIAFVDNDLLFCEGWLTRCIDGIKDFPNRDMIASGVQNRAMRKKRLMEELPGGYRTWIRSAGMCLVMRKDVYDKLSPWSISSNTGGKFSKVASRKGVRFLRHSSWTTQHIGNVPSYHYKRQVFVGGDWIDKSKLAGECHE